MEFTGEILEEGEGDEEEEGVRDMDEFRQMKFKKEDGANAIETKKSVGEFDPNYGVRIGEGKRLQKKKNALDVKKETKKDPLQVIKMDESVQ